MKDKIQIPHIPESERTPVIDMLLKVLERQQVVIEKLEKKCDELTSEIKRLKKHKQKPKIRPSKMDKGDKPNGKYSFELKDKFDCEI